MPASRSTAQIEAARRNGAMSRGPVTAEGKARSSMNALRHGLAAKAHLLLESEDPAAWEELAAGLVAESEPATELEARLVLRLASALWRQDRADRMERAMFVAAPRPEYVVAGRVEHAAPEETFELARRDAIRRYRADASREASRLIREPRQLRADAAAEPRNEPEQEPETAALAPSPAAPATGEGRGEGGTISVNEPESPARAAATAAPAWPTPPVPEPGNRNEPGGATPAKAHLGLAGSLGYPGPRSGRG